MILKTLVHKLNQLNNFRVGKTYSETAERFNAKQRFPDENL